MTQEEVDQLRDRIEKGITFFASIKPSEWRPQHKLWLTRFMKMLKEYLDWIDGELTYLRAKETLEK